MIVTVENSIPVATKMTRIVHGGRGDYIEIDDHDMLIDSVHVPDRQRWRWTPEWNQKVYYFWWETSDKVKFYYQRRTVDYADYKVGFWYVDPTLVKEI